MDKQASRANLQRGFHKSGTYPITGKWMNLEEMPIIVFERLAHLRLSEQCFEFLLRNIRWFQLKHRVGQWTAMVDRCNHIEKVKEWAHHSSLPTGTACLQQLFVFTQRPTTTNVFKGVDLGPWQVQVGRLEVLAVEVSMRGDDNWRNILPLIEPTTQLSFLKAGFHAPIRYKTTGALFPQLESILNYDPQFVLEGFHSPKKMRFGFTFAGTYESPPWMATLQELEFKDQSIRCVLDPLLRTAVHLRTLRIQNSDGLRIEGSVTLSHMYVDHDVFVPSEGCSSTIQTLFLANCSGSFFQSPRSFQIDTLYAKGFHHPTRLCLMDANVCVRRVVLTATNSNFNVSFPSHSLTVPLFVTAKVYIFQSWEDELYFEYIWKHLPQVEECVWWRLGWKVPTFSTTTPRAHPFRLSVRSMECVPPELRNYRPMRCYGLKPASGGEDGVEYTTSGCNIQETPW